MTQATHPADNFFGGAPSLTYGNIHQDTTWLNRWRGGLITEDPVQSQQTDMNTGVPKFWDVERTRPMMQLVVTLVCDGSGPAAEKGLPTDERTGPNDDGRRRLFVKGKDLTQAIQKAFRDKNAPGLRVGGHLYVCWTGTRPGSIGGPARTWNAVYFPPDGGQAQYFHGMENTPQPGGVVTNPAAPVSDPWGAQTPPQTGSQPAYAQQAGPAPQWQSPSGPAGPAPQPPTNPYGHNPAGSPGQQAYAAQNPYGGVQADPVQQAYGAAQGTAPAPAAQPSGSADPWA